VKFSNNSKKEKAIIVGTIRPGNPDWEVKETLAELARLTDTAGGEICGSIVQEIKRIDSAFFIGKGKAYYLKELAQIKDVDTIIFDDDLSPAQVHNLEQVIDRKVIDRSCLILDIFAKNARTKEAKTQVELAQLEYILPRLTGHWTHLSRQVGGIGLKGPGETQLETDRRLIRKRIAKLKSELIKIDKQRKTQRKERKNVFKAILVGYTNAGKSTILNDLTKADVVVEDRLFATLDSTVRRIPYNNHQAILLADTVGFIRKLPHHLIASFRSTLAEIKDANLLLHVVDLSHPSYEKQMNSVNEVLNELNVLTKPVITLFNKIDLIEDEFLISRLKQEFPEAIFISALKKIGLGKLIEKMNDYAFGEFYESEVMIPNRNTKLISLIYDTVEVLDREFRGDLVKLKLKVNNALSKKISKILEQGNQS